MRREKNEFLKLKKDNKIGDIGRKDLKELEIANKGYNKYYNLQAKLKKAEKELKIYQKI